jgi:predicted O-linked N-acetylglucosamine transferase (SPINDLY family)
LAKVTPHTLALWKRILEAVPESRLILLAPNARQVDESIRTAFASMANRIELVRRASPREYLDRYNRIDIALDPLPFNGHTTTCDAAWMGCATVMLAGPIFPYRYGGSVLRNIALSDLVAQSDEEYIHLATQLAMNRHRLVEIRRSLRQTMRRSVICDPAGFTKKLELAYRRMWELHTKTRRNNPVSA